MFTLDDSSGTLVEKFSAFELSILNQLASRMFLILYLGRKWFAYSHAKTHVILKT